MLLADMFFLEVIVEKFECGLEESILLVKRDALAQARLLRRKVEVACRSNVVPSPIFVVSPDDDYRDIELNPAYVKWIEINGFDPNHIAALPALIPQCAA